MNVNNITINHIKNERRYLSVYWQLNKKKIIKLIDVTDLPL